MRHSASSAFWDAYAALPDDVQKLADRCYIALKSNPTHPSLHYKAIGRFRSVRVGLHYRALGVSVDDGVVWFWIGTHADYDKLLKKA